MSAKAINKREIDMTNGGIFKKLLRFAVPLIITNVLQILFNATDVAVVGIFSGDEAVAGVGANTSLIQLLSNLFIGLGSGASVVLSKYMGEKNENRSSKLVGTAVSISVLMGVVLALISFFCAETFLVWMNCDPQVLEKATLYLKIYSLGFPIILLYNFSAGILRAVGDTLRPMIFLLLAGVINVGLNLFFVTVCGMSVDGVAIATVASQLISAVLCLIVMVRNGGYAKLKFGNLKIDLKELVEILRVGLPAGIQNCMFSISNVLIQSTVNTFGKLTMAANTIAQQYEGFVALLGNSIALATMSFVSQNYGAKLPDRIKKVIIQSILMIIVSVISFGALLVLFSEQLFGIMTKDYEVIKIAKERITFMGLLFFIGNIMDVLNYSLRGIGKSTTAMIISVLFVCVFRIIWLNSFYLLNPTYIMIFYSYPISWGLCIIVDLFILIPAIRKMKSKKEQQELSGLKED